MDEVDAEMQMNQKCMRWVYVKGYLMDEVNTEMQMNQVYEMDVCERVPHG